MALDKFLELAAEYGEIFALHLYDLIRVPFSRIARSRVVENCKLDASLWIYVGVSIFTGSILSSQAAIRDIGDWQVVFVSVLVIWILSSLWAFAATSVLRGRATFTRGFSLVVVPWLQRAIVFICAARVDGLSG
jgi:hypothetical protein